MDCGLGGPEVRLNFSRVEGTEPNTAASYLPTAQSSSIKERGS
ncbi:hypothetical protein NY08_3879 [Rhodococcus sp. B7740]|nr:hypothetical protein NY08_3879 [Rhodococcus sp. B7740]